MQVSGWKVNYPDGFWWPSWIYADYESCQKLPSWQQSWTCSRTPLDYEWPNMLLGKNKLGSENVKSTTIKIVQSSILDGHLYFDMTLTCKKILTSEMDSAYMKTLEKSKVSGLKVNFPSGLRRPSWMYADYESCPKLPFWQQSWICSRTPLHYESPIQVRRKENF